MPPTKTERLSGSGEQPTRLQVLLDNYRESRQEGMQLVRSFFQDIFLFITLTSLLGGGSVAIDEPRLVLLVPILLGGVGIYIIAKYHVNSLITKYMIYLESEINSSFKHPVMIWTTQIVRRNVSWGTSGTLGVLSLVLTAISAAAIYVAACTWAYVQNKAFLASHLIMSASYGVLCAILLIGNIVALTWSIRRVRWHTPDHIKEMISSSSTDDDRKSPRVE